MITEDEIKDLNDRISKLEDNVKYLMNKRITQVDVIPDSIKSRHIGEGVRFIRAGLESDLPSSGEPTLQGTAIYFATNTLKLYVWTGSVWKSTTLT